LDVNVNYSQCAVPCLQDQRSIKVIAKHVPIMAHSCTAPSWYIMLQHI